MAACINFDGHFTFISDIIKHVTNKNTHVCVCVWRGVDGGGVIVPNQNNRHTLAIHRLRSGNALSKLHETTSDQSNETAQFIKLHSKANEIGTEN